MLNRWQQHDFCTFRNFNSEIFFSFSPLSELFCRYHYFKVVMRADKLPFETGWNKLMVFFALFLPFFPCCLMMLLHSLDYRARFLRSRKRWKSILDRVTETKQAEETVSCNSLMLVQNSKISQRWRINELEKLMFKRKNDDISAGKSHHRKNTRWGGVIANLPALTYTLFIGLYLDVVFLRSNWTIIRRISCS